MLDYGEPRYFYNSFALRDFEGNEMLTQTWPYFQTQTSRRALMAGRPTPMTSCWNGMDRSALGCCGAKGFNNLLRSVLVVIIAVPFVARSLLRLRGIPDTLAASYFKELECCLIHTNDSLRHRERFV